MKQKLKYKEKTGLYRLNLTKTELKLIANLVYYVRLGTDDDEFKNAAFDLCECFEEEGLDSDDIEEEMNFSFTPTQNGEGPTIEASAKSGCPNCNGCDCQ